MPDVMAALPNIGGALCSSPQFGWRSLLECRAITLPRRETRWYYLGCPKLTKRAQPLLVRKFTILWGHVEEILLLSKFFPIVDTCLSCEDIARQSCGIVPRWRFLATLLWPPYVIGQAIIFLPCGFFLSSIYLFLFYSSPNLSGHRLDVYHTSKRGVASVRI